MTDANNIPAYAALSILNTNSGKQHEEGHVYEGVVLDGKKVNLQLIKKTSNSETGYQGYAYQNMTTKEIYVAHEGSEPPTHNRETYNDWVKNDLGIVLGGSLPPQFNDAKKFLDGVKGDNQNIKITQIGQSLGGSLAQLLGAMYSNRNIETVTFNAIGTAHLIEKIILIRSIV